MARIMTAARKIALRKAQLASAMKRRRNGKSRRKLSGRTKRRIAGAVAVGAVAGAGYAAHKRGYKVSRRRRRSNKPKLVKNLRVRPRIVKPVKKRSRLDKAVTRKKYRKKQNNGSSPYREKGKEKE